MKEEILSIASDLKEGSMQTKEAKRQLLDLLGDTKSSINENIYAFLYNSNIHESSYATVSLHNSKQSAEKAMQEHKQKALEEFNEIYSHENEFNFKFGEHEEWCVKPIEVLP